MGTQDVLAAALGTAAGLKLERAASIRLRLVDASSAAGCRIAGHGAQDDSIDASLLRPLRASR
jgi:hypothetical protein